MDLNNANSQSRSLMPLITAHLAAKAVHVAAQLRVADYLRAGIETSEAVAHLTGADAAALGRLLRALAAFGVVESLGRERFRLTCLGTQLCEDTPNSLHAFALLQGWQETWNSVSGLLHSVRTGEPASYLALGMSGFDYLAAHPERATLFNDAMSSVTREVAPAVVAAARITGPVTVADVGGGSGTLLGAILAADPALRGILFDTPSGVANSMKRLREAGLAGRCQVIAGDFFHEIPAGADIYVLKSVIHDWDDRQAMRILMVCRRAMRPDSRLLLIEPLLPDKVVPEPLHQQTAVMDLLMLAITGGRERNAAEMATLLASAGFAMTSVRPADGTAFHVIEASPAGENRGAHEGRA